MGKSALLVIDVQEDYLNGMSVDGILRAVDLARSSGVLVAHVRTLVDASTAMPHRSAAPKCVIGTFGASSPIEALVGEPVFGKAYFSSFSGGELEAWLRANSVSDLVLVGGYTHACIRETALEAYSRGYSVSIVTDAVFSNREVFAAETLDWIGSRAAKLVSLSSLSFDATLGFDFSETVKAQAEWAQVAVASRRSFLLRWASVLRDRSDSLIAEICSSVFKPEAMARDEVARAIAHIEVAAEFDGFSSVGVGFRVSREPVGVVGLIMPWNNPLALPVGNIAPALMAGNGVVFKPAPEGDAVGRLLLSTLEFAGLPVGLVRLVSGGASVGRELVRHPSISAVAVTGSIATGRAISMAGAELFKPVRAELGGNNAAVVLADADLDSVVGDLVSNVYAFAGQRCTAIRRLVVVREIADEFVSRFVSLAGSYSCSPLISSAAASRIQRQIDLGVAQGASVLLGGTAGSPTLVSAGDMSNVLVQQESFGPVAVLEVADSVDHAIELANGVEQGLVMAVCTNSDSLFDYVAARAQVGILQRGGGVLPVSASAPFVGWKASGIGTPEHGTWDFDFYTRFRVTY